MTLLKAHGLKKAFGERLVLDGVDFAVDKGEAVAIFGPSGGGKSTLLRCLNLLETPDAGTLTLDGKGVAYDGASPRMLSRHRTRVGLVFQHFHLFPHLDVLENLIEAPVGVLGRARDEAEATARALLDKVGLGDRASSSVNALSGGQKQRVAIARALAMDPDVLLLDEVTSALDIEVIQEIHALLIALAKDGMTLVSVTHDLNFARAFADRLVFLDGGRVAESGPTDALLKRPKTERLQRFLDAAQA